MGCSWCLGGSEQERSGPSADALSLLKPPGDRREAWPFNAVLFLGAFPLRPSSNGFTGVSFTGVSVW